ncbi:hypothetical protein ABZ208_37035 [Streptomyces sp. NPDC006208]|uniref:hypothetical protein n=1 Tax=Streptomyces sp. NPDC006208 TaxID=3156734 RepID=UPI0033A55DB2
MHEPSRSNLDRAGGWTAEQAVEFATARELLGAVIAAYSGRISSAASPEETEQLLIEQRTYVTERRQLTATDLEAVARIRRDYPGLLRRLRGEPA